jgi:hypothetical protein
MCKVPPLPCAVFPLSTIRQIPPAAPSSALTQTGTVCTLLIAVSNVESRGCLLALSLTEEYMVLIEMAAIGRGTQQASRSTMNSSNPQRTHTSTGVQKDQSFAAQGPPVLLSSLPAYLARVTPHPVHINAPTPVARDRSIQLRLTHSGAQLYHYSTKFPISYSYSRQLKTLGCSKARHIQRVGPLWQLQA